MSASFPFFACDFGHTIIVNVNHFFKWWESNPRLQPDTLFAVDMFPYKKTELFQKSGFKSQLPKNPGNTPLSGTYLSFLDINTTVSTCNETVRDIITSVLAVWKLVKVEPCCSGICQKYDVAPLPSIYQHHCKTHRTESCHSSSSGACPSCGSHLHSVTSISVNNALNEESSALHAYIPN